MGNIVTVVICALITATAVALLKAYPDSWAKPIDITRIPRGEHDHGDELNKIVRQWDEGWVPRWPKKD